MPQYPRPFRLALAALLALAAACDDSTDPDQVLSDAQRSDVGTTVRDEVEQSLNALTIQSAVAPLGATRADAAGSGGLQPPCATPSSAADTDGDGIPNDATWQFTAPPCLFSGWRGGTLGITGTLRVTDPTPDAAGFAYDATVTNLIAQYTHEDSDRSYTVTRNGSRSVTGTSSGLTLTVESTVLRTFAGRLPATVNQEWTAIFTPAEGSQILINQPLPNGTLAVAGTLEWTRGDESWTFEVATPTPLVYDASCADTPQRFTAGDLRLIGEVDGTPGYLRLRWTGCGREPDVDFVDTSGD